MAKHNLLNFFFLILLLFFHCICTSGNWEAEGFEHNPETLEREKQQTLPKTSSKSGKRLNLGMKFGTSFHTSITNPANFPPYTTTPTIVTVPTSDPALATPTIPLPTPITTVPTTVPLTNPVTDPTTMNPVPVGGTWCIARTGAPETSLQSALDYACGIGGADCSMIQAGASCYNPNSLENHASYAFNSYFQNNPVSTSCDFGGAAVMVNTNPSSGTCVYPSSSTTMTSQPATTTGVPSSTTPTYYPSSTTPPATTSPGATGTPYGFPGSGGYESPPSGSSGIFGIGNPPTNSNTLPAGAVVAAASQSLIGFTILLSFFSTGKQFMYT